MRCSDFVDLNVLEVAYSISVSNYHWPYQNIFYIYERPHFYGRPCINISYRLMFYLLFASYLCSVEHRRLCALTHWGLKIAKNVTDGTRFFKWTLCCGSDSTFVPGVKLTISAFLSGLIPNRWLGDEQMTRHYHMQETLIWCQKKVNLTAYSVGLRNHPR